jgi:hypothetical protein
VSEYPVKDGESPLRAMRAPAEIEAEPDLFGCKNIATDAGLLHLIF